MRTFRINSKAVRSQLLLLCMMSAGLALTGCESRTTKSVVIDSESEQVIEAKPETTRKQKLSKYKPRLSDYDFFELPMKALQPASEVVEYHLNTALFSDYSEKQRLISLPAGTSANYTATGPLDFPVGTVIAKTFFYQSDSADPSKRQLVETRILEHREAGWVGIPYVWNEAQSDAELAIAGASVDVSWMHSDGEIRTNVHSVPNLNDCKRCHTNLEMEPIGPKAYNLNRDIEFADGSQNQLEHWKQVGFVTGIPDIDDVPRLAVWDDEQESLDRRARAYLEVNCAHCHNGKGPARNSGLHLNIAETDPYHLGTFKTPVAAGKGTGGRLYGIVPGKPDESIMEYRMFTTKPGEIMPEFGKSLVHEEGHALIRDWIGAMK